MEKIKLSPYAVLIWRLRATAVIILCAFALGAVFVFNQALAVALGIFTVIIYILVMLLYIPLLYKSYYYTVENGAIEINKGVIIKKRCKIFANRVQYTRTAQTPAQKYKNVCSVIFFTAGAAVTLACVSTEQAKALGEFYAH
ncbi:MAG: PH domain-containing protein [Acutalibacteraceae bacterium]